ncbi:transposase [Runella sp.]|uniref:transposase n=1 Tax=Runella sp. TaxID=1960881 RepID=UPI00261EF235|nr:transposase [Runella sp.]
MEKPKVNRKRRKYDENFKLEVLKMVDSGRTVPEVSAAMGIGENLLYKWKADDKSKKSPNLNQQNAELEQLRKQLKQAEMERDILKKALSIFSRQT